MLIWIRGYSLLIFPNLSGPIDNVVGIFLGAGIGVINYLSHFLSSFGHNLRSSWHLLGDKGLFDKNTEYQDGRHIAVRIVFGALSLPLVLPLALITNVVDITVTAIMQFSKHLALSFWLNLRSTYNLLGSNSLLGESIPYLDDRHLATRIAFGILSAPLVAPFALITNAVDTLLNSSKHLALSFWRNLRSTYNLLGSNSLLGGSIPYEDNRHLATRIVFGLLSAPFVGIAAVVTNAIDSLGFFAKHTILNKKFWQYTTTILLGIPTVMLSAIPIFCLRKTFKGLYNLMFRHFFNPFDFKVFVSGLFELGTLGGFSLLKKLFKGVTGYTKRFGFPDSLEVSSLGEDYIVATRKFKEGIDLAAKGKFPGIPDGQGIFRPVMRLFYRMRHTSEKVIKEFHNAYLKYVDDNQKDSNGGSRNYSMAGFFNSRFNETKNKDFAFREGETEIFNRVEQFLNPSPSPVESL
jgi:hypothetical protein